MFRYLLILIMDGLGMTQNRTFVIGVTGGIGSGKSTVSKMLSEMLNAPLIDADKLARDVTDTEYVKEQIKSQISADVFDENNVLNRKKLGDIVFNGDEMRTRLNGIVHPAVRKLFYEKVYECSEEKFVIYDCPLLIEADLTEDVDHIILVYIDKASQIQRIISRDLSTEKDAISRINAQMPMDDKIKFANTVIYNDSSFENLEKALKFVCEQLRGKCTRNC